MGLYPVAYSWVSPLVKEAYIPLCLLGALCSTRLKSSIDLQAAQPSSHLSWQLPPLRVQQPANVAALVFTGKASCSHRRYPILCNVRLKKMVPEQEIIIVKGGVEGGTAAILSKGK